jgi:WD40 repeat protein
LRDESTIYIYSPGFSPDGKFIANRDEEGNIYLWNRTKGLVANWHGHDRDDDEVEINLVSETTFSPAGNLLVTVGNNTNIKILDLANDNRGHMLMCTRLPFHQMKNTLPLLEQVEEVHN